MPDQLERSSNGTAFKNLKDMGNGTHAEALFVAGGDTSNPLPTIEQAAMGYDPSTGRTPVEQSNNAYSGAITTAAQSAVIKSAPGFLHMITVSVPVAGVVGTHLAVFDNTTATGTALLGYIPLPAVGGAPQSVVIDALFSTGLAITAVNLTISAGVVTATAQTQATATAAILVNASFR